jgi:multicomponent Na+:H+ antiporter subunit D
MSLASALPPLPVAIPLLTAAFIAGLRQWLSRAAADTISIVAAGVNLVVCALLLSHSLDQTIVYWFGGWYPRGHQVIGISFVIDPAAAGLATLTSLLTFLALLFSWRFIDAGDNHYHPLMLVFLAAMCGFALTGDLFNMFVFFELMSTAAFALCGLKSQEPAPLQGAFNFAITNTIAAFMVLTGIALLYSVTGALNMAQIGSTLGTRHDGLVLFAATLLTCGFFIKGAIVPFHFWLPDAHAVAPTSVCVLFSGLMVELGLYAVLRLHTVVFGGAFAAHPGRLRAILLMLGLATVLLGGIMCYAEHHLKRMLAFSTVSHAGLMLIVLALHSPLAVAALLVYLLAHALVKSSLFFCSGMLLQNLRTISEPKLFGRGRTLRLTAVLWFAAAAGLAGAPPFLTMAGEALSSRAAEPLGLHWLFVAFIVGGVFTGGAALRAGMHIFFGWGSPAISDSAAEVDELPETRPEDARLFWYHYTPPAVCVFGALALTFSPALRAGMLLAGSRLANGSAYVAAVYSGHTAPVSSVAWPGNWVAAAAMHGVVTLILALLLAFTSVFRLRLPRALRLGAFLEGPLAPLRTLQSGHSGDYVLWITTGAALIGAAFLILLQ